MEVEAKFSIPDNDTLVRLRTAVRLGPYVPGEGTLWRVLDRYLDTRTRALHRQGYACRVRRRDGECIVTVKGLTRAESAVHRRFETELVLPEASGEGATDPMAWPEWDGRELVLSSIGPELLEDLFVVEQLRFVRKLGQDERLVAELSIDEGHVVAGGNRQGFRTLEAELIGDGTMADLQALEEHLARTWGLAPEPRSKYEMGLALLDEQASQAEVVSRLSTEEVDRLADIAAQAKDQRLRAWAQLLLGWAEGRPVRLLGAEAGLSRSWAYELIRRFRGRRLEMFLVEQGASSERGALSTAAAQSLSREDVQAVQPGPVEADSTDTADGRQGLTVAEMCERFQIDQPHARHVAAHAMTLFDATVPVHRLSTDRRRLLEVMSILHQIDLETGPDRRQAAGSDILLQHRLVELTDMEQRMVTAAIHLHRKPIKRRRLKAPVVTTLPSEVQHDTLALAALLRTADGLDYMQSQTTTLGPIHVMPAAIEVTVFGPYAGIDAGRAQGKADLWDRLFGVPIRFSAAVGLATGPASQPGDEPLEVSGAHAPLHPIVPGIVPDDTMAEAGRKVLHIHLLRMLDCEPATRAGQETEALHDMRVATRRMRAAFRVFGSHFSPRAIRPYVGGLRATAQVLGAVRDQDVLMGKAKAYLETLPPEQVHDLDPLLEAWQEQRNQARDEMLAYLDSERYQDLAGSFLLFLRSPGAGVREGRGTVPEPRLLRHVAPRLIYARWARVLAFGPFIEGAPAALLHALRMECKRLRYCLEFLAEVLGSDAQAVIAEMVRLQDHLGDLHDADVANGLLSAFLFSPGADSTSLPVIAPGVVSYLAAKQRELQTLMRTFPGKWEEFSRPEVRRWLANAVAAL